jgi:hypothetical protein
MKSFLLRRHSLLSGVLVQSNGRTTPPFKPIPPRQLMTNLAGGNRREKSGVPALDRYLSDGAGEATEAEHDEDEDWDFLFCESRYQIILFLIGVIVFSVEIFFVDSGRFYWQSAEYFWVDKCIDIRWG